MALALSLVLPVVLLVVGSVRNDQLATLESPRFLLSNWLYMGLPQLLWGILVLAFARRLLRVRLVALLALDTLLVGFQLWIWYRVPGRDGADAWILYVPLWVALIVVAVCIRAPREFL
jgi:hypothetical protein